jgi:ABC-2 type transport system permease protein
MSTPTVLARTGSAEWSRLWSVRSTWFFAGATALVVLGFGTIFGYDVSDNPTGPDPGTTAWDGGRFTAMFALFGVLALSVVTSTADHGTGGIVPTLQWTPRRGVLLAARAGIIAGTMTLLGATLVAGASAIVWAFRPSLGLPFGQGVETMAELGFVYAGGALLGVGLGLLTRSTAAALVSVIALMLVLPLLLAQLPYEWSVELSTRMPGSGALFLIFGEGPRDDMTTTSARLTLGLWAVALTIAGGWRLLRTDADR